MSIIVDKRIINLSSNHGTQQNGSYNSSVGFYFQGLVKRDPDVVFVEIGVISAEIPVSFYIINDSNNQFRFTYRDVGTGLYSGFFDIVLAKGNYTATTLITELNAKMLAAISGFTTTFLALTISRSTGKLIWNLLATGGGQNVDGIRIYNAGTTGYNILGFDMTTTYFEFFKTTSGTSAVYPLNLLGTNKINIQSNNMTTFNYDSGRQGFSNILASIEVDAPPYGIILYKNSSLTYNILSIPEVEEFTIDMKTVDDDYIDFNNQPWSVTLALNLHRTPPSFSQSTFKDILAINTASVTEPAKEPVKEKPAEPKPLIQNELDLLTMPLR
jgi:hypothetical protein